jgi:hypothetical protein
VGKVLERLHQAREHMRSWLHQEQLPSLRRVQ